MREITRFKGYRFDRSEITLNPPAKNETFKIAPFFELTCKASDSNETLSATLSVTIKTDAATGTRAPFDLKVSLTGDFELGADLINFKKGQVRFAIETLFPYMRAFVSNLTAMCGLLPFILPLIDVEQMVSSVRDANELPN
ncbi:MAG: protein-export chaperone SecB [Clostridia bacterium]|nr:protein-export chaperone SecB [Clostridia bacterium]